MREAFFAEKFLQVVKMAEGLAVAEEVRRARPDVAALIHCMIGDTFVKQCEHMKGLGLLKQARALAVESGNRQVLGFVCSSLGGFHRSQGEYEKAIEAGEMSRAIAVEFADRQNEKNECHNLGLSYMALKQYDKAIELFEQSLAVSEELGERSGQAITCLLPARDTLCLVRGKSPAPQTLTKPQFRLPSRRSHLGADSQPCNSY